MQIAGANPTTLDKTKLNVVCCPNYTFPLYASCEHKNTYFVNTVIKKKASLVPDRFRRSCNTFLVAFHIVSMRILGNSFLEEAQAKT